MAHFAELDDNNVVLRVTVVNNDVLKDENGVEQEALGLEHLTHLGGRWVQTSYSAFMGKRINVETNELLDEPGFRKNYAGIGHTYDEVRDAFIPPKPFESWILNEDTCRWESPVPLPNDGKDYLWDEESVSWKEVTE